MNGYLSHIVRRGARPFGQLSKGIKLPWSTGLVHQSDSTPFPGLTKESQWFSEPLHKRAQTGKDSDVYVGGQGATAADEHIYENPVEKKTEEKRELPKQNIESTVGKERHSRNSFFQKSQSVSEDTDVYVGGQDATAADEHIYENPVEKKTEEKRELPKQNIDQAVGKERHSRNSFFQKSQSVSEDTVPPIVQQNNTVHVSSIADAEEPMHNPSHEGEQVLSGTEFLSAPQEIKENRKGDSVLNSDRMHLYSRSFSRELPRYPALSVNDQSLSNRSVRRPGESRGQSPLLSETPVSKESSSNIDNKMTQDATLPFSQTNSTVKAQRVDETEEKPVNKKRHKSQLSQMDRMAEAEERFQQTFPSAQPRNQSMKKDRINQEALPHHENKPKLTIKHLDIQVVNQEPVKTAQKTGVTKSQSTVSDSWQELDRFYLGRFYLSL